MKQWLDKQTTTKQADRSVVLGISLLAMLVVGAFMLWKWYDRPSHLVVSGLGDQVVFSTKQRDLGAALAEQDIKIGPKDKVSPPLSTTLERRGSLVVEVTRAIPVWLTVEGRRLEVLTAAPTVGGLLTELAITVGEKDRLSVDDTSPVTANMEVKLVRHTEQVRKTQVEVPFDTVKREDQNLPLGETVEVQAGVPGVKELIEIVHLEDGQVVDTELKAETVVQEPTERIVAYGTVGVVYRGGRNYRYSSELTMTATGYTAGKESNPNGNGYTYTGMKAVRGVVAVDPRVIPLYTRLYIEGYGPAVAADIGGAIKGSKIDLCFDTVSEALEWGRRPVKVYILGD